MKNECTADVQLQRWPLTAPGIGWQRKRTRGLSFVVSASFWRFGKCQGIIVYVLARGAVVAVGVRVIVCWWYQSVVGSGGSTRDKQR